MASQTTNIELVKQANSENWSNDIHNANLEKIDEFAGEMKNKLVISAASINALKNSLDSALAAMPNSGVKAFQVNFTVVEAPFTQASYLCTLYKSTSNVTYADATFRQIDQPIVIDGARNTNGWIFNSLSSKTTYNGTANSNYISALEGQVAKNGSFVSGYFVLTANADFSAADITLISNLPAAYNQDVQLSCIGLSGTNINKASRVRITTSGTITTWYGFEFKSGESYLISVNYICA